MGFRFLPYKKAKKGVQIAGVDYDDSGGGGGGGDTSSLANKTDLTAIILTGTTNTSGDTITEGTWFYLNGVLVKAKADIANGATFTENTNYEAKTIGDELTELNSNISVIDVSNEFVVDTEHYTKNYLWAYKVGKIISFGFDITLKQNVYVYQPGPMITTPYSFPQTPLIVRTDESGDYKFDANTTNLIYVDGTYIKIFNGISGKSYQGQATLVTLN